VRSDWVLRFFYIGHVTDNGYSTLYFDRLSNQGLIFISFPYPGKNYQPPIYIDETQIFLFCIYFPTSYFFLPTFINVLFVILRALCGKTFPPQNRKGAEKKTNHQSLFTI
jgi:hypothetical protein